MGSKYLQYLKDNYNVFEENSSWYVDDYKEYHLSKFIQEVWIGENPPDSSINTIRVVEVLLQTDEKGLKEHLEIEQNVKPGESIHLVKKLINLKEAVVKLFQTNTTRIELTIDFIKMVHKDIGRDIISDCDTFRSIEVRPSGSVFQYLYLKNIEYNLKTLLDFTQTELQQLENSNDKMKNSILLGTLFFSEFLFIHPFINGNGRIARLLLNYILRGVIVVPFSLYFKNRQTYIDAIESRNNRAVSPPNILATYILLCISQTSSNLIHLSCDT